MSGVLSVPAYASRVQPLRSEGTRRDVGKSSRAHHTVHPGLSGYSLRGTRPPGMLTELVADLSVRSRSPILPPNSEPPDEAMR